MTPTARQDQSTEKMPPDSFSLKKLNSARWKLDKHFNLTLEDIDEDILPPNRKPTLEGNKTEESDGFDFAESEEIESPATPLLTVRSLPGNLFDHIRETRSIDNDETDSKIEQNLQNSLEHKSEQSLPKKSQLHKWYM